MKQKIKIFITLALSILVIFCVLSDGIPVKANKRSSLREMAELRLKQQQQQTIMHQDPLGDALKRKLQEEMWKLGLAEKPADATSYTEAMVDDTVNRWIDDGKDKLKENLPKLIKKSEVEACNKRIDEAIKVRKTPYRSNNPSRKEFKIVKGIREKGKQALKEGEAALKKTQAAIKKIQNGIGVIFAIADTYQYIEHPEIGYNSSFLEFTANSVRGMAIAGSVALVEFPTASKVVGGVGSAVTSEVVVKLVNDSGLKIDEVDDFTDSMNELMQMTIKYWFYGDVDMQSIVDRNEEELVDLKEKLKKKSCTSNNINVYKPNIYLYPTRPTEFTVTFMDPSLLTVTDPIYRSSWKGIARENGTLLVDGREYGFLFYESLTDKDKYQTREGFSIPANNRAQAFESILAQYGLNQQEISDFVEFWDQKLEKGVDYAMYPQKDRVIDEAMPIRVYPVPESSLRIWFAFVKEDVPSKTAKPEKLVRDGFTLVEWGGFLMPDAK